MPSKPVTRQEEAAVLDRLEQISNILNTGLDRKQVFAIKQLCEYGVNPQALAQVIRYLRREGAVASNSQNPPNST